MASSSGKLLIAIDVGMTCTGVAFAIQDPEMEMPSPHVIQKWPGNTSVSSDKVPTTICYGPDGKISSWGFLTRMEQDHRSVKEWFKIFFDPHEYSKSRDHNCHLDYLPPSHEDVKRYYHDFLSKLYQEIKKALRDNVREWSTADIEFLFSVPTTWTKLSLTQEFQRIAKSAGFGKDGVRHRVEVSLTESEAAAVYTFKSQKAMYSNGDIILIVDAGGGTTDIALMKVKIFGNALPSLESLDQVRGDEIGSVEIDMAFAELAEERLRRFAPQLRMNEAQIRPLVDQMVRSDFKMYKEEFGTEDSMSLADYRIDIPSVPSDFDLETANIRRGKFVLSRGEMIALFDEQLKKMYGLIDYQMLSMDKMERVTADDRITHLVLSGGLGSSKYIKDQLQKRYQIDKVSRRAPEMRVMSSTRPQLAVVNGLIFNRMQKLKKQSSILSYRASRQSLGVLCCQLYDPVKYPHHMKSELFVDPIDKKRYARDQIRWFVKQGQPVRQDDPHIDYEFYRTFMKGKVEVWESKIVMSNSRLRDLPMFKQPGDGITVLCTMKSDLRAVDQSRFEKHKKHWWESSKKAQTHLSASYVIRFILNAAGIDSQLLFQGQEYSETSSFEVVWEAGYDMPAPKEHRPVQAFGGDREK